MEAVAVAAAEAAVEECRTLRHQGVVVGIRRHSEAGKADTLVAAAAVVAQEEQLRAEAVRLLVGTEQIFAAQQQEEAGRAADRLPQASE